MLVPQRFCRGLNWILSRVPSLPARVVEGVGELLLIAGLLRDHCGWT